MDRLRKGSTSGGASVPRANGWPTGRPRPSSSITPRNFTLGRVQVQVDPKPIPTDGDPAADDHRGRARHSDASWYELPLNGSSRRPSSTSSNELAVDRSEPRSRMLIHREPPGAPLYIGQPPPPSQQIVAPARRSGRSQVLGVPLAILVRATARRPWAEGRFKIPEPARDLTAASSSQVRR